ncbi:MAG: FAD-dependent thymidylate synthase [Candidatus Cloacimonadia bacterium]
MKIRIAGYNIDERLIKEIKEQEKASPETISAAYARISRSSKSVTELRDEAIGEVQKARRSNKNIIFDMGHSSIAEHAVFNIDIIGVSRYITETIQKSRLASFTEKSQRYVTLKDDYVIPAEIEGSPELKKEFVETCKTLFALYKDLTDKILEHYKKEGLDCSERQVKEMAKEDARYALPLATKTQMGMTINARSIEQLLRRLNGVELLEAKEISDVIHREVKAISPSLIRYVDSDSFYDNQAKLRAKLFDSSETNSQLTTGDKFKTDVKILTADAEERILAAIVFNRYPQDFEKLVEKLKSVSAEDKAKLFEELFSEMKAYHQTPREFEMVDLLVQCRVSASCFAQLKRHRMMTIIRSEYATEQGFFIPRIIEQIGEADRFSTTLENLSEMYDRLEIVKKGLGTYALTNAHAVNVLFKTNLRELYHFSRLRSDAHAQWEIRELSQHIDIEVKKLLPNAARHLMGKDAFQSKRC